MKKIIVTLAICLSLVVNTGCATMKPSMKNIQDLTPAQLQSGFEYLSESMMTVKMILALSKQKYPDKKQQIEEIEVKVIKADEYIQLFKTAMDANKTSEVQTYWDLARPLITVIVTEIGPLAINMIVK